jgi:hypothetical protein
VPGEVYEVPVPLLTQAYRWLPGHRMQLMIAAADLQNAWPTPYRHVLTLHCGPEHPSRLLMPLRAATNEDVAANSETLFRPSDFAPDDPALLNFPTCSIERDMIGGTVRVRCATRSGIGINTSSLHVDLRWPEEAKIVSEYEYPMERPGVKVLVRAECVTWSDREHFHHTVRVAATLNGIPYWEKTWIAAVPRVGC